SDIKLDFSVGLGSQMFFEMDNLLNAESGQVATELDSLTTSNAQRQTRVEEMTVRLDLQREVLLAKYIAMETALTSMNQTIENLSQMTESTFSKDNPDRAILRLRIAQETGRAEAGFSSLPDAADHDGPAGQAGGHAVRARNPRTARRGSGGRGPGRSVALPE